MTEEILNQARILRDLLNAEVYRAHDRAQHISATANAMEAQRLVTALESELSPATVTELSDLLEARSEEVRLLAANEILDLSSGE